MTELLILWIKIFMVQAEHYFSKWSELKGIYMFKACLQHKNYKHHCLRFNSLFIHAHLGVNISLSIT